jgi:chromosomal replication initiation ATPase DnaA
MKHEFAIEALEASRRSLVSALDALDKGSSESGRLIATREQIEAAKPIVREKKAQLELSIALLVDDAAKSLQISEVAA